MNYTYNAFNQRVIKALTQNGHTTTTHYHYGLNGELIAEQSEGANAASTDYLYFMGTPIAQWQQQVVEASDTYYLVNLATQKKLRAERDGAGVPLVITDSGDTSDWAAFEKIPTSDGYFYLRNLKTNKYFRPSANQAGALVEQRHISYRGNLTQWKAVPSPDEGYVYLQNRGTGKYMRPTGIEDGSTVEVRHHSYKGHWTRWKLQPVSGSASSQHTLSYIHTDHLATPKVLTSVSQDPVWQADYDAFGEATVHIDSVTNHLRFPGQYYDAETDLHYNWHRYYDPSLGRYITSDPIGLNGGINTYGYVDQNPNTYYDPNGLSKRSSRKPASVLQSVTNVQASTLVRQIRQIDTTFSVVGPSTPRSVRFLQQALYRAQTAGFCGPGASSGRYGSFTPNFVVGPNGVAYPVPTGAVGPRPITNRSGNVTGSAFINGNGGANGQVSNIRMMNSTQPRGSSPGYPNGYIKY